MTKIKAPDNFLTQETERQTPSVNGFLTEKEKTMKKERTN